MTTPDIVETYDAIIDTLHKLIGDATVALYDVREKKLALLAKRRQLEHYAALSEEARDQAQGRAEDFRTSDDAA